MTADVSDCKSVLVLKSLGFDHVELRREMGEQGDGTLKAVFSIQHKNGTEESSTLEKVVRLTLNLTGGDKEQPSLCITVSLVGVFEIDSESAKLYPDLVEKNTIAMMMPYVRSQVTLLTAQPGLVPLVLPPIDINKLVEITRCKEAGKRMDDVDL